MKILIAISSREYSEPTLKVGMKVAHAFNASTTIVDVGEKVSEFSLKEVGLAYERMQSWDFDRPGVNVLEWAFEYLSKNEFIKKTDIEAGFPKNTLVQTGSHRTELFLKGTVCEEVNLILRNGEIIEELRDEVKEHQYDVTIIGGSKKRRMAHNLIQYIDSSIFVVNQFNPQKVYKLLLAVDDSPKTKKAVRYGLRIAQAFNVDIDIITISKTGHFGEDYRKAAEHAAKFIRRCGVKSQNIFKTGDPVEVIKTAAGDDHIIVMGTSTQSPLKKFFKGSKPLKVMENCKCPVLIVK